MSPLYFQSTKHATHPLAIYLVLMEPATEWRNSAIPWGTVTMELMKWDVCCVCYFIYILGIPYVVYIGFGPF